MIHAQNIEYRQLDILRVRFLQSIQESAGLIKEADFRDLFRCVVRDTSLELEQKLIESISEQKGTINYYKLCEIINLYQYHFFRVK